MMRAEKKLKTLKDLEIKSKINVDDYIKKFGAQVMLVYNQGANDLHGDLRHAAREWIKHLEEFENKEYSQEVGFDRMINKHYYHKELLEEWILHFFNLEESE